VYAPLAHTSFLTLALVLKWSNDNKKQQTNQTSNGKQNKAVVWYTYNQHNKFLVLLWQQHICYSCPNSYNNNNNSAQALFLLQTPLMSSSICGKRETTSTPPILTHSKWRHFLFMLMLYFGLQEMLDSPWNERFRLPLSAQEALRYWSSASCSSFCTTNIKENTY